MNENIKILTIQDISCYGQCSITVALPIISEFATPFFFDGNNVGTFVVGFSQDIMKSQIDDAISMMLSKIKVIVVVTMIFGLLLSYLLGYSFAKPIKMLTNAAEQISKGNLDVEIKELIEGEKSVEPKSNAENDNLKAVADYNKDREKNLIRKIYYACLYGIVSWIVSFIFST